MTAAGELRVALADAVSSCNCTHEDAGTCTDCALDAVLLALAQYSERSDEPTGCFAVLSAADLRAVVASRPAEGPAGRAA